LLEVLAKSQLANRIVSLISCFALFCAVRS
jgi:hypothetical protein